MRVVVKDKIEMNVHNQINVHNRLSSSQGLPQQWFQRCYNENPRVTSKTMSIVFNDAHDNIDTAQIVIPAFSIASPIARESSGK